jgi:hypothetical protein
LKEPVRKVFGLHNNVINEAQYQDLSNFVDIMVAKLFEGIEMNFAFTIS